MDESSSWQGRSKDTRLNSENVISKGKKMGWLLAARAAKIDHLTSHDL